jgi:hypothetical protein
MSDFKIVSWKEIFQKAVGETDREKQMLLVQEADLAIFRRQQHLYNCVQYREELGALNVATEALRLAKHAARSAHRTKFPG